MKIDILAIIRANLAVKAGEGRLAIARANRLSTRKCPNLSRRQFQTKHHARVSRAERREIFGFPLRNRNDVESLVSSSTRFREFKESLAT